MKKNNKLFSKFYLALIMLFFYLPIFYVILFSFNESRSLTSFSGFSLQWYEKMFKTRAMMESIYYSTLIAIIATAVSTVIGTIVAIGLFPLQRPDRYPARKEYLSGLQLYDPDHLGTLDPFGKGRRDPWRIPVLFLFRSNPVCCVFYHHSPCDP